MVKIILNNMKQDNSKSYKIYKPTKPEFDKYEIIYTTKTKKFIQFILYSKFVNTISLSQPESSKSITFGGDKKNLPYNGIQYSCLITPSNPLVIAIDPLDLCSRVIIKKQIETPYNSINFNPIQFDKIFVINLLRRPDRKKQMENFFIKTHVPKTNYEFVEAVDGQDKLIQTQYEQIKKSNPSNLIITSGHFACLLSHLRAIKLAKSRGYKSIMILEDDVFTEETNFISKLNSIKVPNYDLLYLGGITSKKKFFTSEWAWSGETNIMGAYGYILNLSIYDVVLSGLENLDEYIDFYYLKHIQPNYKTIILGDIIKTDLTSSDTSNKSRTMVKRLDYIK